MLYPFTFHLPSYIIPPSIFNLPPSFLYHSTFHLHSSSFTFHLPFFIIPPFTFHLTPFTFHLPPSFLHHSSFHLQCLPPSACHAFQLPLSTFYLLPTTFHIFFFFFCRVNLFPSTFHIFLSFFLPSRFLLSNLNFSFICHTFYFLIIFLLTSTVYIFLLLQLLRVLAFNLFISPLKH